MVSLDRQSLSLETQGGEKDLLRGFPNVPDQL